MKDFHELVTEAGRRKSIIKGRKAEWKKADEDSPDKEPMRPRSRDTDLKDRLSPLYRWLGKQCGQPWNKVYSDLSEIDFNGVAGVHIKNHIDWWVEKYPVYINDIAYYPDTRWFARQIDHESFYVDKQGILRRGKKTKPYKRPLDLYTKKVSEVTYYTTDRNLVFVVAPNPNPILTPISSKYLVRNDISEPWKLITIRANSTIHKCFKEVICGPFTPIYEKKNGTE